MKKLILFLILFLSGGFSWATPDIATSTEYSGNTQIKSSSGTVYSINVAYIGATAGNYIQILDGVGTTASTSPIRFTCVASASSGNCLSTTNVAYYFGTGIFYKESNNGSSVFKTDIQSF